MFTSSRFYPAATTHSTVVPPVPNIRVHQHSSQSAFGHNPLAKAGKATSRAFTKGWANKSLEDKLVFWSAFTYVPAAILTPITTHFQLKAQKTPDYERKLLVNSEIVRQVISATLHFIGFFGGLSITKGIQKGLQHSASKKSKAITQLLGSIAGTTLMSAFARPLLLNTYVNQWIKANRPQHLTNEKPKPTSRQTALPTAPALPLNTLRSNIPAQQQPTLASSRLLPQPLNTSFTPR
jgi:hypothetical protein